MGSGERFRMAQPGRVFLGLGDGQLRLTVQRARSFPTGRPGDRPPRSHGLARLHRLPGPPDHPPQIVTALHSGEAVWLGLSSTQAVACRFSCDGRVAELRVAPRAAPRAALWHLAGMPLAGGALRVAVKAGEAEMGEVEMGEADEDEAEEGGTRMVLSLLDAAVFRSRLRVEPQEPIRPGDAYGGSPMP